MRSQSESKGDTGSPAAAYFHHGDGTVISEPSIATMYANGLSWHGGSGAEWREHQTHRNHSCGHHLRSTRRHK